MKNTYILKHIERFGNCYISNRTYRKLGKKRILDYLNDHGYKCDIEKHKSYTYDFEGHNKYEETDIIIYRIK